MQEIKTEMNPVLNPRSAGPEGSLIGIPGINQLISSPLFDESSIKIGFLIL